MASVLWDQLRWREAEAEFRRALTLNPGYATARSCFADFLAQRGLRAESTQQVERALAVDPLSPVTHALAATVFFMNGDVDRAVEHGRTALDLDPGMVRAHLWVGRALLAKGDCAKASREFLMARSLAPVSPEAIAYDAIGDAACGRVEAAREALTQLDRLSTSRYVSRYDRALLLAALRDYDSALAELRRAAEQKEGNIGYINVDPIFAPGRRHPVFLEIVEMTGLAETVSGKPALSRRLDR